MKRFAVLLCMLMILFVSAGIAEVKEGLKIAIPGREKDMENYVSAIEKLGAEPVLIWNEYDVCMFDGLLLPGGRDICPERYGQQNIACGPTDAELDEVQFAAAKRFIQAGIPVFGICRGQQLLNVYFGGTLVQDLKNAEDHKRINRQDHVNRTVALEDGFLAPIYGNEFSVSCSHHQAVDCLGSGMRIVQWAEDVVEAIQHESLPIYSVQWHPERMCFDFAREETADGSKVLEWFLSVCEKNKMERRE